MKNGATPRFLELDQISLNIAYIKSYEFDGHYLKVTVPHGGGEGTYHVPSPRARIAYEALKEFGINK